MIYEKYIFEFEVCICVFDILLILVYVQSILSVTRLQYALWLCVGNRSTRPLTNSAQPTRHLNNSNPVNFGTH